MISDYILCILVDNLETISPLIDQIWCCQDGIFKDSLHLLQVWRFCKTSFKAKKQKNNDWLVVSTHLKQNARRIGSFPQGSVWKYIWNHHLLYRFTSFSGTWDLCLNGTLKPERSPGKRLTNSSSLGFVFDGFFCITGSKIDSTKFVITKAF